MQPYKEAVLDILDPLTCRQCKAIFTYPVTLECGHTVCWACADEVQRNNRTGRRCCCCPDCGAETVMENAHLMVNPTLCKVAAAACLVKERLGTGLRTPEGGNDGVSETGLPGDIREEYPLGSSCSISNMQQPPSMDPGVVPGDIREEYSSISSMQQPPNMDPGVVPGDIREEYSSISSMQQAPSMAPGGVPGDIRE